MKKLFITFAIGVSAMNLTEVGHAAGGGSTKTVCGIVHDYGDSLDVVRGGVSHYIPVDNSAPSDPQNLTKYIFERQGSCLCVTGKIKSYDRAGEKAYRFTTLTDAKVCPKK